MLLILLPYLLGPELVTSPTHFSIRCVRVCAAHRVLCGSESTGSERAGRALSIWKPTCPFLSPLFQAVPAGGVARRPRPSALGAQRDQGLHLRPCQRIHRREQDPGRRSGDGPEDPAGGRVLTCERRQLKGLGRGAGEGFTEDGGQQHAVTRWRSAFRVIGKKTKQNTGYYVS